MKEIKLRIAIQKSGRMNEDLLKLIKDCGILVDNGVDQLKATARNFPLEIFFLRNSDIPEYVADGVADVAIVGENLLVEDTRNVEVVRKLGFSKCGFVWQLARMNSIPAYPGLMGKSWLLPIPIR